MSQGPDTPPPENIVHPVPQPHSLHVPNVPIPLPLPLDVVH